MVDQRKVQVPNSVLTNLRHQKQQQYHLEVFKRSIANLKVRIFFGSQANWTVFIWKCRYRFDLSNWHVSSADHYSFSVTNFCKRLEKWVFISFIFKLIMLAQQA